MSDIVIVSRDTFRNGVAQHVPYGTILVDDEMVESDQHSFESLQEGVVPAVDWRGVDSVRRRGRPKGSKNRPKGSKTKV